MTNSASMTVVGKNISRRDGVDKVTGGAKYIDDITLPAMWHGAVVRTTIPYGKVLGYDLDHGFDWKQVVVADAKDIPGENCVAMIEKDVPLIIDGVTKHIGEAVCLIAAPTRELALEARKHVKVSCEEWKPVLTIDEAKKAEIKIAGDDNVLSHYTITKGDVAKGFKSADQIIEGEYSVGYQEHMYIEPQGMIAEPRGDGGFNIIGSMQCPYYISKAIAGTMGMPEDKFAIRQATVGGAFGGKEDYPSILAGYCAVLANKAKRPIKMVYDRDEDTEVSTKRHPARMRYKTGVKRDGKLVAMEILVEMNAGAYVTMTPVVLSRALIHSAGPYKCDNVNIEGWGYATNNPHSGAFRGFGAPQVFFALESHMDEVAEKLELSPLEFRKKNMLLEGDTTATGQKMDESCASREVIEMAAKNSDFEKRRKKYSKENKHIKRGVGMAFFFHGAAFTGSGEDRIKGQTGFRIEPDGSFTVLTACTDMGQGAHTVIPQMAADHLGVDLSLVGIETPDTSLVPNSGPTVASRTTMIMGMVLERASNKMKEKLFTFAADLKGTDAKGFEFKGEILFSNGKAVMPIRELVKSYVEKNGCAEFIDHYVQPPEIKWDEQRHEGDAYPTYGWGCDVAEVEVDMDTFEFAVKKLWMAIDIGKAINPKMAEGQLEGGTLQSVGYGMMEKFVMEEGRVKTNRFQTYIIPTFKDTPEMETILIEKPYRHGPMGAKGLGELPMNGGAPAVANAIAHATGIRIRDLPITPEKLFEKFKGIKSS